MVEVSLADADACRWIAWGRVIIGIVGGGEGGGSGEVYSVSGGVNLIPAVGIVMGRSDVTSCENMSL